LCYRQGDPAHNDSQHAALVCNQKPQNGDKGDTTVALQVKLSHLLHVVPAATYKTKNITLHVYVTVSTKETAALPK
jgi:hypothetical protein